MNRITDTKDLSTELDLYFKIFNAITNPIFVKDKRHRFVLVNDACCELFNIKREEFLGKSDALLFPTREWKIFHEKDQKILKTGVSDVNEETATTSCGKKLRLLTRKSLLKTSTGDKFVLGISTDITEKASLLKKVKESEKKYKTIFNLGNDPAALFRHPELKAIEVNDAFLSVSGVTRKSVVGKKATHAFSWVDPKQRQVYFDLLQKNKKVDNMEIQLKSGKGEIIPFIVSSRMLKLDQQTVVLFSLKDITEHKNIERYILRKIIETEEVERQRFAADLHDDLGPILSTVKLHLGIMEKAQDIKGMRQRIKHLDTLLTEVIEKVHNISHNITSHLIEDFGMQASIQDLCAMVRAKDNFKITFTSNLDGMRFPRELEVHFYRITSELINNTMKHSGAKKANLDLSFSDGAISLTYSDDGKGYDVNKILEHSTGMGIQNIIQRTSLLNCDLEFVPVGNRTEVRIRKKVL